MHGRSTVPERPQSQYGGLIGLASLSSHLFPACLPPSLPPSLRLQLAHPGAAKALLGLALRLKAAAGGGDLELLLRLATAAKDVYNNGGWAG